MSGRLLAAAVLMAAIVAIAMVYAGERRAALPPFVSPEVAMALGHAEATAYARRELPPRKRVHTLTTGDVIEREADAIEALEDAREAVIRIAITHKNGDVSRTSHGSGVLVEAGRFVLTVGHVVADVPDPAAAEIKLFLPRPRVADPRDMEFDARLVDWRCGNDDQDVPQDWALLEVVSPMDHMPSASVAATPGSRVLFCYGFPAQLGLDAKGDVISWLWSRCLAPLLTIVEPATSDPIRVRTPLFTPLAGCLTHGGQSGGPMFDANGAVVYLISGNNTWWNEGQHQHWVRGASLDAAIAAMKR